MRSDRKANTRVVLPGGVLIAAVAALVISSIAAAQSSDQILNALDADGSGAISKDEALDDMKANFSFIDANGDGGIDLDELTQILKMMSSR